jgi:hypothetical protein
MCWRVGASGARKGLADGKFVSENPQFQAAVSASQVLLDQVSAPGYLQICQQYRERSHSSGGLVDRRWIVIVVVDDARTMTLGTGDGVAVLIPGHGVQDRLS